VSNAKPKVADYPFTTLAPSLGMVRQYGVDMVLADLPGLIEGASEGVGLGHRFLKHTSRCSVLLHVVDIMDEQPAAERYQIIRHELEAYDKEFSSHCAELPEVVALNKKDAAQPEDIDEAITELQKVTDAPVFVMSAHAKDGVNKVLEKLAEVVQEARKKREEAKEKPAENTPEDTAESAAG